MTEAETKAALEAEAGTFQQRLLTGELRPFLNESAHVRLRETPAGKVRKAEIAHITLAGSSGTTRGDTPRRIEITRYDYATGLTVRSLVEDGAVIDVRADFNYPTPLSKGEEAQALSLARAAVAEINQLVAETPPDQLKVVAFAPNDRNPVSPRFGHRLALLWIEKPRVSQQVVVDLSANEVVR